MKSLSKYPLLLALLILPFGLSAQTEISLDGVQSMSITGKGPGQDAAINPYKGDESIALVKNVGANPIEVRIQKEGKIIKIQTVEPQQEKSFELGRGVELYLDSTKKSKALIDFKKKTS